MTTLKVFAIDYPKANAKATTVSSETPEDVIVVLVTDVNLPFASTAKTGTWVALPYVAAVTPEFANVAEIAVVPDPVTSPDTVMVWFPVMYVDVSTS